MSYTARWTWEFDAPRERLWEYLADTDWVNAHAGLPRIEPRFKPLPEGGTRKFGSFRRGPIYVEWEEMPTVWRVPEFYTVERRYAHGPLRRFVNTAAFEVLSPSRTRVVFDVELEASTPLLEPLLPLIAAQGKRGANRAFSLGAKLAAQSDGVPEAPVRANVFAPLLDAGIAPVVVAALEAFVAAAEDRDLLRMRPYELADRWQLARREVLRAFLAATRAGRFNLRWNVICPGCRGPMPGLDSLGSLKGGYHCPNCNVPFDAVFDRTVEVTFNARPLGRGGEEGLFCIASPQRSAHVYAQTPIGSGSSETMGVTLPAGSYDFNAIGVARVPFVTAVDEAERDARARIDQNAVDLPHAFGNGTIRFTIDNQAGRDLVVRLEDGRWPDTLVTAAHVTALQEFRDLFSSEVLAPGLELGIETLAVLFTDLVGSTAMYSRTGDAPAFRIVTDHFDALREIVARHDGTIVKTIGDAVMAAFSDPADCFAAAIELDGVVMGIQCDGVPLRLRVGFHSGPCIAMRANDRIDYFGTNVNLAARLESLAAAGEVTMARSDAEIPAIAERLAKLGAAVFHEALSIKGFEQPIEVVRVANLPS
ncbi:MAG TPA: adenylate/guanylate cyclase domain-containing protein [Candidatus Baltobacteraceae bacterium]|nr:adenylate/guanylate cyclase domain-containing protein [Candidatus Baltobacteraceae bacterium]